MSDHVATQEPGFLIPHPFILSLPKLHVSVSPGQLVNPTCDTKVGELQFEEVTLL